jgi:hypothetical protein
MADLGKTEPDIMPIFSLWIIFATTASAAESVADPHRGSGSGFQLDADTDPDRPPQNDADPKHCCRLG